MAHIATLLLLLLDSLHRANGNAAGLFRRQPPGDFLFDSLIEVITELFVELPFHLVAPEQRAEPESDSVEPPPVSHSRYTSFSRMTREMAPANRSQLAASRSKARRPGRVRE